MENRILKNKYDLVIYDPPPPYGGVYVSADLLYKKIFYLSSTPYIRFNSSKLYSFIFSILRLRFNSYLLFQIGGINTHTAKRFIFIYLFIYLFRIKYELRIFAGRNYQQFVSFNRFKKMFIYTVFKRAHSVYIETNSDLKLFSKNLNVCNYIHFPNYRNNSLFIKSKRSFKYTYIGSLTEQKGIFNLLDIFSSLQLELHLYGDNKLKLKDTKNIKFHKQIDYSEVTSCLVNYDWFVFPTMAN